MRSVVVASCLIASLTLGLSSAASADSPTDAAKLLASVRAKYNKGRASLDSNQLLEVRRLLTASADAMSVALPPCNPCNEVCAGWCPFDDDRVRFPSDVARDSTGNVIDGLGDGPGSETKRPGLFAILAEKLAAGPQTEQVTAGLIQSLRSVEGILRKAAAARTVPVMAISTGTNGTVRVSGPYAGVLAARAKNPRAKIVPLAKW